MFTYYVERHPTSIKWVLPDNNLFLFSFFVVVGGGGGEKGGEGDRGGLQLAHYAHPATAVKLEKTENDCT